MQDEGKREPSAQDPVESRNDIPPPEKGSPGGNEADVSDEAAEKAEKGEQKNINRLSPPVNIQGGS